MPNCEPKAGAIMRAGRRKMRRARKKAFTKLGYADKIK